MTTTEVRTTEMINKLFIPELADIILSYYIEPNEHKLYKRIVQEIKHYAYDTMCQLERCFIDNESFKLWFITRRYWRTNQNYGYDVEHDYGKLTLSYIRDPQISKYKFSLSIFKYHLGIPENYRLALRKDFI